MQTPQYYPDYLALDKILDAQHPVSFQPPNTPAHDEMLFIIIHQAYELWFKQILHELDSVLAIMQQPTLNDNSPHLQTVVHRLNRINTIMGVLVQQIDILETMTPMDFLDFRDLLRPASGFQSVQFKTIEAKLGLRFADRFGQGYYTSALKAAHAAEIKATEQQPSLMILVNDWLHRMPFFEEAGLWQDLESADLENQPAGLPIFWLLYRQRLQQSLHAHEADTLPAFDAVMRGNEPHNRQLSGQAARAALFIMLYRGYPMLQQPFQLINALLELDEQLSTWRYRHMNMVHRTIGTRIGTGGSSGKNYLKGAADSHYIFSAFAQLTSFLVARQHLPALPAAVERRLGFVV
jgi:tryptophan 2,3-dioxygenase